MSRMAGSGCVQCREAISRPHTRSNETSCQALRNEIVRKIEAGTYGRWVEEGEPLGFDRPPRRYGMVPLWGQELTHPSHTKPVS